MIKTECFRMLVLICLSCNLHANHVYHICLGLERVLGLSGLYWYCQDFLIMPDIFVLMPETMMVLVLGMIGI